MWCLVPVPSLLCALIFAIALVPLKSAWPRDEVLLVWGLPQPSMELFGHPAWFPPWHRPCNSTSPFLTRAQNCLFRLSIDCAETLVDFLISRSFLCCLKYKEADPVFSHPCNRRTIKWFFQRTQIVYAKVQYANPDLFMPRVVHTKSCLTWSQYISLSSTHTSLNPPPPREPGEKTL